MRSVIQYEIYFLKEGRWTLHGRFPAAERQEAIKDAMISEGSTGFPTKVIRETYFPDSHATETVTIYTSPKLKALIKSATPPPPLIKPSRKTTLKSAPTAPRRSRINPVGEMIADFMTRAVLAACLSTVAAALVTGMVSWLLSRLGSFGVPLNAQMISALLSFVSVGMFGLGFVAFFRAGARFKNIIRKLWASASLEDVAVETVAIARKLQISPKDVHPKHPSRAEAEVERATQEMKRQRGDPDALLRDDRNQLPTGDSTAEVAAPKVASESSPLGQPPAPEPIKSPQASEQPLTGAQTKPMDLIAAKERSSPTGDAPRQGDGLELERLLLTRFVAERVVGLVADHTEDPITRRGLAFLMSGAVAHLVVVSKLDHEAQDRLLTHALAQCRLPPAAVDAFMQHRSDTHSEAGWKLQDAGRAGMLSYLEGKTDSKPLADAWREWRVPVRLVTKPDLAGAIERPRDTFLVTEVRDADDEAVMELHNRLVRTALEETGGLEVKHTGKGILAKFEDCNAAVAAAISIAESDTSDYGTEAGWIAVALIPGYSDADDPLLSPRVSQLGAGFLSAVRQGEIACDRAVLAAASRGLPPGYFAHDEDQCAILRMQAPTSVPAAGKTHS